MLPRKLTICVWRGKAYLPGHGRFPSGIYALVEPIHVADITIESLTTASEAILASDITNLPEVTTEVWRKRSDPLLKATKARSWKELARIGALYTVNWIVDQIVVDMSYRDKQGRWQNDPAKVRLFPLETALEDVLAVILADIHTRPEVFETTPTR